MLVKLAFPGERVVADRTRDTCFLYASANILVPLCGSTDVHWIGRSKRSRVRVSLACTSFWCRGTESCSPAIPERGSQEVLRNGLIASHGSICLQQTGVNNEAIEVLLSRSQPKKVSISF